MNRERQIVAVEPEKDRAADAASLRASVAPPPADPIEDGEAEFEHADVHSFADRAWPALAILAVVGWTGFFGYVNRAEMLAGGSAAEWIDWVATWASPVLLVLGVWLLLQRNSRQEAARYASTARALSNESALLEKRLVTINRELSLAREFIASEARDLESVGRLAVERLSGSAERLSGLVKENGDRIESIASVSTTALENMDKLRGELPVIANSARDVTNQVGNAGRTAQQQLEEMVGGFERLNAVGRTSEEQVGLLQSRIELALRDFEAQSGKLDDLATARFEAMREGLNEMRGEGERLVEALREGQNDTHVRWATTIAQIEEQMGEAVRDLSEADERAIDQSRERLTTLRGEVAEIDTEMSRRADEFISEIERRKAEMEEREASAAGMLEERLSALDSRIAAHQEQQLTHISTLAERGEALADRLLQLGTEVERVALVGDDTGVQLDGTLTRLAKTLAESRGQIGETDTAIQQLTDSSVRLLELIRAGARHSQEQLPEAIAQAESRLAGLDKRTEELGAVINQAADRGKELSDHVAFVREGSLGAADDITQLHTKLTEQNAVHLEQLERLRGGLAELDAHGDALAEKARGELGSAVAALDGAVNGALASLQDKHAGMITSLAEKIGADGAEAIGEAMRTQSADAIRELEQAAISASSVSREAAAHLRDQLSRVNELTANLEHRVSQARERAEEQVNNEFARRMALITESLNSAAIDIASAMSLEVSDPAWAAYLRGDRGIFTRRAVRLLDGQQAREVLSLYDTDSGFREHVNRYIHDFESMLRSMLSTRDGNALGVTMLSSDMGKLYVSLAQAIERLRD
jgi:uncharacterized phage infection (PIP) family protein YhgE